MADRKTTSVAQATEAARVAERALNEAIETAKQLKAKFRVAKRRVKAAKRIAKQASKASRAAHKAAEAARHAYEESIARAEKGGRKAAKKKQAPS